MHRRYFEALVCIGRARDDWQVAGLDAEAENLLALIDASGPLAMSGPSAKTLEHRLLVSTQQVHTKSGAHATELASWTHFAKTNDVSMRRRSSKKARTELEGVIAELDRAFASESRLPWVDRVFRGSYPPPP